ncbi:MAG: valine--tRNA ligase [Candidatus Goldiibacteriota bacterium HGW-Goldbacteria-1]|nr:MAG: valine--tRNA ligase [Candidatus Goldiibacteriota bacterium HGW-Goldbacteria-1]
MKEFVLDKYIPEEIEGKIYSFWTEKGYFKADENSTKPPFCVVIPPPNVTGSLHMGHALNNTLQDILCRYKRARGFNVLWVPGCDHAGIATQNVVERELKKEGKKRHDLGREKFVQRVWEWKEKYGTTIMMQLRKLGSSLDWSRERFTMDEGLSEAVKEVFVRLYNEKLIYRGDYIINWCPRCHTALSDIEVEHKDLDGHFYHIKYPYKDKPGFIQVATTRPETLLGDTAVAVNPDDPRYKDIPEGTMILLPETGRAIPLIKDEYVDKEFGTGAVKITPAHDPNDFLIGLKHKLEMIKVMDESAKMNENAGAKYQGMDRFEARKKIMEALEEQGLVVKVEDHKHAVGHCYRCNTVIEPYVSTQWFVKIKPLAQPAIKAVEDGEVQFTPDMWKKVYFEWMNNIKDWCISRQLWWGHRIPAWYCECGEIIVSKETPAGCPKCGSLKITQDEDVLDTWFSSALWPFSTLGWPKDTKDLKAFYPTSVLVTSWDILFFWVARMIMTGIKFMEKPPFAHVVINSLVCDSEGKKMSKSKGNVVDPLDIISKYSADSLRFTMATLETATRHIAFSEDRLKGYSNFMNKIWNAAKFVKQNLEGYKAVDLDKAQLKLPEKWILSRLNSVVDKVTDAVESFKFSESSLLLYDFFWHDFCDWYLEIAKIDLYKEGSDYKNTVQTVLAKVLKDSLILMHPYIPFITEEIYGHMGFAGAKESIMKESWPFVHEPFNFDAKEMDTVMDAIYVLRNARGQFNISPAEKLDGYIVTDNKALVEANRDIMITLAKLSSLNFTDKTGENVAGREVKDLGFAGIDMKGKVDTAKETEKAKKAIEKFNNGIKSIETKLSNPKFTENAPKKLVDEENAKIEKLKSDIADEEKKIKLLERLA